MLTPSGDAWITSTVAPSAREGGGRGAERGAVAAVEHHVQIGELAALQRVDERRDVVVERGAVLARHADAEPLGSGLGLRDGERAQFLLHFALERLGDLAPAGCEQLDAVVAEGVVTGGDHCRRRAALDAPRARRREWGARPTNSTSAPSAHRPAISAASSIGPERRVSRPTTNGWSLPSTAQQPDRAR